MPKKPAAARRVNPSGGSRLKILVAGGASYQIPVCCMR